jgi:hypothetical protein
MVDAQFSMPFGATLTLTRGTSSLADFQNARRVAPELQQWMDLAEVHTSAASAGRWTGCWWWRRAGCGRTVRHPAARRSRRTGHQDRTSGPGRLRPRLRQRRRRRHVQLFVWLNRAKESVVLDLKAKDGRRALDSLIGRAESSSVTSRQRPSAGWAWKPPS